MRAAILAGLAMLAVPLAVALASPPSQAETGDYLVPDLVSLPPDHFTLTAPDGSPDGCLKSERAAGAQRCLRFTTYLANVGAGSIDLGLAGRAAREAAGDEKDQVQDDGASVPLPLLGANLVQRLHAADGSWQERPAGIVEYHPIHRHYHVAGLVSFTLRAVGADGQVVADANATAVGGKTGFCLLDGSPGGGRLPVPAAQRTYHRWNCKALRHDGVGMGISPGWVDRYNWTLADQYLEVSGVPDGEYELTVAADPQHTILQTRTDNDSATVRLRLDGGTVTVLPTESP